MKNLHEITRAILTHEKEEFDKSFTLSQIKELDEMIEGNLDSTSYNYIEPDFTKYTYVALDKCQIDDLWYDATVESIEDCYLNGVPEQIKNYFNYDKFFEDVQQDGRANHFNGYDGSTELETEDYYIYYHNQNYKRG